jgi:hypothetical protein
MMLRSGILHDFCTPFADMMIVYLLSGHADFLRALLHGVLEGCQHVIITVEFARCTATLLMIQHAAAAAGPSFGILACSRWTSPILLWVEPLMAVSCLVLVASWVLWSPLRSRQVFCAPSDASWMAALRGGLRLSARIHSHCWTSQLEQFCPTMGSCGPKGCFLVGLRPCWCMRLSINSRIDVILTDS